MNQLLAIRPVSWLKGALYGLLIYGLYCSTFKWLIEKDWSRGDYGYGYIIPVVVLYLIWEKKSELAALSSSPSWRGLAPLGIGIILFWLGELSGEFFSLYLSFWFMLIGLCWLSLGWNKLKTILFALCFSVTMFPLPGFVNNKITLFLKLISSQIGVELMRLMGMSAYREGNVIDLGFTQLQVVDACSGLRYFIPLIILGILLAYFFKASWWKKAVVVISTIPISIIVNSLRIASVGILYPIWGPAVAEGFFHDFSGWFIFMLSLGILLLEMWVLKKVGGSRLKVQGKDAQSKKLNAESSGTEEGVISDEAVVKHMPGRGLGAFFQPPQFIVAVVLLGATLALSQGVEFREKIPISKSFDKFPMQVGEWIGSRQTMEQEIISELDLSDYVIVDYKNTLGKDVNFYVAYYESQSKGESIHSPETCLPGGGWIFNQAGKMDVSVGTSGAELMPVNRAFMQKGDSKQLTYFWFPMRGRILTNAYQMKIYTFWDALTRQRTDGALVRVITPVYGNEELGAADERLQGFVREIVPVLDTFLPK